MKAASLLKANIDALLRARHQTNHDLAQWCRRSDAWLSKILGKDNRNVPLEYLDRIADFFGLATYQLFQPGLTGLLERRKGDRRTGRDRRLSALNHQVRESVSAAIADLSATDVADLLRLRSLPQAARDSARTAIQALERSAHEAARQGKPRPHAERALGGATKRAPAERTRAKDATGG
jgi:hypothetical protein